jgi:Arc/MetJ-type ribon-helix-helix transcriptional regulator
VTIRLPQPLQSDIMAAVHSGRYASFDDAMTAAASRLIERLKEEQAEQMAVTRQSVAEMISGTGMPASEMLADMQRIIDEQRAK